MGKTCFQCNDPDVLVELCNDCLLGKSFGFDKAIALIKQGKRVKRAHWGGYWFLAENPSCEQVKNDGYNQYFSFKNGLIVAVLKDGGGCAPATPYQGDLLANDWEVVE